MKTYFTISAFFLFAVNAFALEVENPVALMASRTDLTPQDYQRYIQVGFKRIQVDINGDGKLDMLLCHDDPEADDTTEAQARSQWGGMLWWDIFVKKENNNGYIANTGSVTDNVLGLGAPVAINPDSAFIGQITEIDRFGIVTMEIANPREGPSMSTIYAYTWEGDHLKRQKLAEYKTEQENPIFDKYLAKDKRTVLQVQQITP